MNATKYIEIKYLRLKLYKPRSFLRRLYCFICNKPLNSSQRKLGLCKDCIAN